MQKFLELTLADGKELDIPNGSIMMMEEMTEKTNPNFPEARSFIHYAVGREVNTALLKDTISDLFFHLDINVAPVKWLKLTRKEDGLRVVIPAHMVVSRMAIDDGCRLTVAVGDQQKVLTVNESRREIKKWSDDSGQPAEEKTNEELPPADVPGSGRRNGKRVRS